MASADPVINEILIRAKAEGFRNVAEDLARGMAAAKGFTGEMFDLATATNSADSAISRTERSIEALSRKYIDGYREARELESITNRLNTAVAKGSITQERAAAILAGWAQRNRAVASSMRELDAAGAAASARLSSMPAGAANDNAEYRSQQLRLQFTDLATQIAMGGSISQALIAQGGQISGAMEGVKGWRGAVSAIGAGLAGMLSPLNLAILGFTALGAGISWAWAKWSEGAPTVEDSLKRQVQLAELLTAAYGDAAEAAQKVAPPTAAELRFDAAINFEDLRKESVKQAKDLLDEIMGTALVVADPKNPYAGLVEKLVPEPEFEPFAAAIDVFRKSVEAGAPAVDVFRAKVAEMAGGAPDAAKELLKLAENIRDVSAAAAQAERNAFLARIGSGQGVFVGPTGRQGDATSATDLLAEGQRRGAALQGLNDRLLGPDIGKSQREATAAFADVIAKADARLAQLRLEATLWGATAQAAAAARIEYAAINALTDRGVKLTAEQTAKIRERAQAEAAAIEAQRVATSVRGIFEGRGDALADQIDALRISRDTFGGTTEEITRAVEAQRLMNELTRSGVSITAEMTRAIDVYASKMGEVAAAAEELAARQKDVISALDTGRNLSRDLIGGTLKDLSKGKNPLEGLISAVQRAGDNLIDQGVRRLVEGFMGKDGTAQGMFGGFLADLFGVKDAGVPAALSKEMITGMVQIQAASVIVSGGLGLGDTNGLGKLIPVDKLPLPPISGSGASSAGGIGSDAKFAISAASGGIGSDAKFGLMKSSGIGSDSRFPMGGQDMSDIVDVVSAGRGFTTVRLADGSVMKMIGARNWRNNNPGNIEFGKFARSQGAVGSDGRFAVFPDYEAGRAAKEALLFDSPAYRNRTIESAINRYAPPFENDTNAYAAQVARATGVPLNTPLSALTADQRNAMLDAMQRVEGFRPGQMLQLSGPTAIPAQQLAENFQNMVPALQQMTPALTAMQQATQGAGGALQMLPQVLQGLGGGGGGGGGLFGFLGSLFGGGGDTWSVGGGYMFAEGGVANSPSIFGERGPEAAVPLSKGRFIPVEMRMPSAMLANHSAVSNNFGGNTFVFNGGGNSAAEKEEMKRSFDAQLKARDRAWEERMRYSRESDWRTG